MPTPFTHLAIARRMRTDEQLSADVRGTLNAERGAFYLGQVAADGHFLAGRERYETHFYKYTYMPAEPPWRVMMKEHPTLWNKRTTAGQAFLAGYIAHLAVDEYWSRYMATPYFGNASWGSVGFRFLMLNILLIGMDERDYATITQPTDARSDMADTLYAAQPADWLPFLPDRALCEWGALIHRQIKPDGVSETLDIIAPRLGMDWTPAKLRQRLDATDVLEKDLWSHVPRSTLAEVEAGMYAYACSQVSAYWQEKPHSPTPSPLA